MPFLSTPLTLAATGSILGSAWISGGNGSLSFATIPAILQSGASADGLVRAWYTQFSRSLYIPVIGVVTGLNYFHLAYRHHGLGREWRGYAAAGLANVAMVPFTLLFIGGINNTLMVALPGAQGRKALSLDVARHLIGRWGELNFYRVFMGLAGAGLGLWNLLSE